MAHFSENLPRLPLKVTGLRRCSRAQLSVVLLQQQQRERELRKQHEREQRRRYEEMEQLRREEERRQAEREQVGAICCNYGSVNVTRAVLHK